MLLAVLCDDSLCVRASRRAVVRACVLPHAYEWLARIKERREGERPTTDLLLHRNSFSSSLYSYLPVTGREETLPPPPTFLLSLADIL